MKNTIELSDSEYQRIYEGFPTMQDCLRAVQGVTLDVDCAARFTRGEPTMSDCRALLRARHEFAKERLDNRFADRGNEHVPERNNEHVPERDINRAPEWMRQKLTEDVSTASEPSMFHLSMFRDRYK